jgi:hypothetical protein
MADPPFVVVEIIIAIRNGEFKDGKKIQSIENVKGAGSVSSSQNILTSFLLTGTIIFSAFHFQF